MIDIQSLAKAEFAKQCQRDDVALALSFDEGYPQFCLVKPGQDETKEYYWRARFSTEYIDLYREDFLASEIAMAVTNLLRALHEDEKVAA